MVLQVVAKRIAKHQSADRITVPIGPVGVEFSAGISVYDVQVGKVTHASYLDVIGGFNKVNALEGAIGDDSCAAARLCTPSDFFTFCITNGAWRWGSKQAEIVNGVNPNVLTHGSLRRGRTAVVGTTLTFFRLVWQRCCEVAHVPNLVRIAIAARPYLNLVAIRQISAGQIHAFSLVLPHESIISVGELLILVICRASPDLQLSPIHSIAVGNFQALVIENTHGTTRERPLLTYGVGASLKNDRRPISI